MTTPRVHAFILAAGYGERLKPITNYLPKPLLPFADGPLLGRILNATRAAGVERLAVNAHHLADKLRAFTRSLPFADAIAFFEEKEILGTGGALTNARDFIENADLCLLRNGDVMTDLDIREVIAYHQAERNLVTMVLTPGPANRVRLRPDGRVTDIAGFVKDAAKRADDRELTFTGVSVLSPEFAAFLPEEPVFATLIEYYVKVIARYPDKIKGFVPDRLSWDDLGSVKTYFEVLRREMAASECPVRVDPTATVAASAELSGFVLVGANCRIGENARLQDCVLLDDVVIPAGSHYYGEIVGPDFSVHRDRAVLDVLNAPRTFFSGAYRVSTIAEQGSKRKFYRLRDDAGKDAAMMLCDHEDPEFERWVAIGEQLFARGLGAPKIYHVDRAERAILMEDLGDDTLCALATAAESERDRIMDLYGRCVDFLARLERHGKDLLDACQEAGDRTLDFPVLRWETDYCREHFLEKIAGVPPEKTAALAPAFDALAETVSGLPKVFIHRDFQSQNILIVDGLPRIVDFQGARRGPLGYDLASLLNDAYFTLSEPEKETLIERYRRALKANGVGDYSEEALKRIYLLTALQRGSQIMGAYGYLSLTAGKKRYLDYVLPGLARLKYLFRAAETVRDVPPTLRDYREVVMAIREDDIREKLETLRAAGR